MATYVLLCRHAKPIEGNLEDDARSLSDEGKALQKKLAWSLKKEQICPKIIYTSPLIRAKQSAEILSEILSSSVIEEHSLGKDFNSEKLLRLIPLPSQNKTIGMVGHAPTLAEFVNQLTGKNSIKNGLPKSSAALVEFTTTVEFGCGKYIKLFQA